MYETGPGLLPGALPLWDAKGHPLFFFFLSSVWMRLTGTSVFTVHILPLLISLCTLLVLFFVVKKHVNLWAANISVFLFSVQSLFLAQATMLLPEMLVTLLLLLSVGSYLSKNYWLYTVIASTMVMTKETSIAFIGGFLIFHMIEYFSGKTKTRKWIVESAILAIPVLVYGIFLFLHKRVFGSFFFQEHTNYIQLNLPSVINKIQVAVGIIFTRYGRNIILIATIVALSTIFVKKKKLKKKKLLGLLVLQTIIFILFSSLNFYTHRYMLGLMALFMIIAGILLEQAKLKKNIPNRIILAVIISVPLYFTFAKKTNADCDLFYVDIVKVYKKMVKYCEKQDWNDEPISSSFNLIFCLQNPHLGYVSTQEGFSNVTDLKKFKEAKIFINDCTSNGFTAQIDSIKNKTKLAKDFRLNHAWGEIFTNLPTK